MASNDPPPLSIQQPKPAKDRAAVAKTCCSSLGITMPMVVDEMDDRVGHAYSGMPDRLYMIDRDGRVAYKGGRGPMGFKPGELEQSVVMLLLDQDWAKNLKPTAAAGNRSDAPASGGGKASGASRQRSAQPK